MNDKLNAYRSSIIRYYALCEAPALFSIIVFFLTGDYRVFAVTALCLLAMAMGFPSRKKLVQDLQLDWQEEQDL